MAEQITLGLFVLALILCIVTGLPILYALGAGLIIFMLYGRKKGFSWKALLHMAVAGVFTARNVLLTFLFIGILTAVWRMAGTIPVLVSWASVLIKPSVILLITFLLNALLSVLTGTSFGTAATMGVICATMGRAMGADMAALGGAVLAGAYFGDRCSPVSTSALLVSELTGTNIFDNIRRMVRSSLVPFLLSCALYLALGRMSPVSGTGPDLREMFSAEFSLHPAAILPAVVITVLSLLRVPVRRAMAASILTAIPIAYVLEHRAFYEIARCAVFGFAAADADVAKLVNGGGIVSMVRVFGIVCLSSSYAGIFRETGLLDGIRGAVETFARRTTGFAATALTSVFTGVIACNQTLTIMLTHQLCGGIPREKEQFALDLEDTAVVLAPLVPWSIAGTVPLASVGAPLTGLLFPFYLYLLPLWRLGGSFAEKKKPEKKPEG